MHNRRRVSLVLATVVPLLLAAAPGHAQEPVDGFAGVSILLPYGAKGLDLTLERHLSPGRSMFLDGSLYGGALVLLCGLRLQGRGPVAVFAHLQGGALVVYEYGVAPTLSGGLGLEIGGLRLQVDGLFAKGGPAARVSLGLV